MLITFSANDFANLEYLKGLSNDDNRKKEIDELIVKIKALTPQKICNLLILIFLQLWSQKVCSKTISKKSRKPKNLGIIEICNACF